MQLKRILKKVTKYKGFVFTKVEIQHEDTPDEFISVTIEPRKGSRGICPKCGKVCPTYDTDPKPRWFQFVSIFAIPVGRKFATLVYQINADNIRLLHVSFGHTEKLLVKFFVMLNKGTVGKMKRSLKIEFVCSDMWKPYLTVIAKWCGNVLNILDRFHIKKHLNDAVNQTRTETVKKLKEKGKGEEKILTKSKFLF